MISCGCTTNPKPQVITEIQPVVRHIPAGLKRKCPRIWKKQGAVAGDRLDGAKNAGDLLDRGNVNKTGLLICAARMDKVIEWDDGQ
ncbi:hypothetical protein [Mesorhizobium sp. M2A.F.Ca.ET.067.02.1.1]|uniref:hypothetical protein n=1 Tax=Mesorhizobium sp. M2A.F.Ca.ET.067.02.1.1 TaxID=2496749 RepID=UPI000FD26120|nr:hypothetical protein [Mesorhizobium sp. M2A.F.Ca.ET.067.02.1.1]RUW79633.1 hypothetical protein EOA28_07500 [Mesorhizobium sp. M2A.F.Ca.ET.067.02.1.1]